MKPWKYAFILINAILIIFAYSACESRLEEEPLHKAQLIDFDMDVYEPLLYRNGYILYSDFSSSTDISFYQKEVESGLVYTIGTIESFVMRARGTAVIDRKYYLYLTVTEGDTLTNKLVCIDLEQNTLSILASDTLPHYGVFVFEAENQLLTIRTYEAEGIIHSYIEAYDVDSADFKIVFETEFFPSDSKGSILYTLCYDSEKIYAIVDERQGGEEKVCLVIWVLDANSYTVLERFDLGEHHDYLAGARIGVIKVLGNNIFVRNFSSNTVIGVIHEKVIEPLVLAKNIDFSPCIPNTDNPLFFVRDSNRCYQLNQNEGGLYQCDLNLPEGYSILSLFQDGDTAVIRL